MSKTKLPVGADHYLCDLQKIEGTNITPLSIKGGVVNGDFELAPTFVAPTTTYNTWVDGTSGGSLLNTGYGWAYNATNSLPGGSIYFDSTEKHSGNYSLKVSTLGTGQIIGASNALNNTLNQVSKYSIKIIPGATYTYSFWMKTNYISGDSADGAYLQFTERTATPTTVTSTLSTKVKTTTDWTEYTGTVIPQATTVYIDIVMLVKGNTGAATLIMDAWFDDIKFEQTTSITNSSSSPALFYPTATAVTSTDNIDQSQVESPGTLGFGLAASKYRTQQFLPTKKYLSGFVYRKGGQTGTYTGTVTLSVQKDNGSNKPDGTDLITPQVISNATWLGYTDNTDLTVTFPTITLTVDGSTKYHIVFTSSTADNSNYTRLQFSTTDNIYANGAAYRSADFLTFTAETKDLYFKTLYEKHTTNLTVSTDTETVSVTASTVDGWENGFFINTFGMNITPLTLAPGANDIFVSSNGPLTADGTVDPSLQLTLGGNYQ